jgi:hypothetical protein
MAVIMAILTMTIENKTKNFLNNFIVTGMTDLTTEQVERLLYGEDGMDVTTGTQTQTAACRST